jgi:arginase
MTERRLTIVAAPSTLGLVGNGVEALPGRLLDLGLADRIDAVRSVHVPVAAKTNIVDSETHVLNAHAIAEWSPHLADALGGVIDAGEFPVVLGGDCTIVLGSMLALRRRGRYGLLFIDGNADFFQPLAEPNGEGASMDLAFVTGHGPALVTDLEGRRPIVRSDDAVAFGFRDHEDQRQFGSQPLPTELMAFDIHRVRHLGAEPAARLAVEHLTRPGLEGFFVHLDADVLDDAVMPAVDFRVPGGLTSEEVTTTLEMALASGKAVGMEVTIYNPELDSDGRAGRVLADILSDVLARHRLF